MKKLGMILLLLLLCVSMVAPALAQPVRLVDEAGLLADWDAEDLSEKLDAISNEHNLDVVVVTANTLNGQSPRNYADDFFDYNGYSADGILLLVSIEDRDWWISTAGHGITAFTDAGIEYLGEQFVPFLSEGEYAQAFDTYATLCDEFLTQAENGDPYDVNNLPKEPFAFGFHLIISLGIGFVLALIVTAVMKSQLKTVRSKQDAGDYVKPGSLNVTHRQDLFLYRNVHRTPKPKDGGSSTHRSSSGRSHGGGGGKF